MAQAQPESAGSMQLEPGSTIDHFRVMRLLGRGGMAEVYLSRDERLGRKVALKVVRPDALGTRDAVERFVFEARATARFNHPNIVTVYAVGEHSGRPYVALEYLEGQTLRERLEESRPSVREALRFALSMAEALAEAHRHDILHRDLKPENVLIPKDGRLRVVDFGLAKHIADVEKAPSGLSPGDVSELAATLDSYETAGEGIRGTPLYMAPEQWMATDTSGATDVWALGLVLYEMLAGRLPYQEGTALALAGKVCGPEPVPPVTELADVKEDLGSLVADCLEKDPASRPSSDAVAAALGAMVHPGRRRLDDEESPFPGLLAYSERLADFFFGREAETTEVLERLREEPVLPVVGPSGAGKSSFVRAGVIPRLREQGSWLVLTVRPGSDPLRALASKVLRGESTVRDKTIPSLPPADGGESPLDSLAVEEDRLAEELQQAPGKLNLLLRRLAEDQGSRVLLFADQLEELYTLTKDVDARQAFMRALSMAADDRDEPVRVIFTLRDDYLGSLAEGAEVREALSRVLVLRSPGPQALEEILVRPLETVGYEYDDPGLVPEMIGAVGGEPACLPLLQFATRTLWDRRDRERRTLRRAVYDAVGGVAGALATHADGVLEGLSPSQHRAARELLLGLVTPDGTRRAVARRDLVGDDSEREEVLGRLVQARLLSVRRNRSERETDTVVELAHESLIRSWRRLARWIDESKEEIAFLSEATQAAELWERRGSRAEELWSGDALHEAQRSLERCGSNVPEKVAAFIGAAIEREGEAARRAQRRRQAWTAALGAATVLAALVAFAFAQQREEARHQARETRLRWAEGEVVGALGSFRRGDFLEARSRLRGALEVQSTPAARALWWRLEREPELWIRDFGAVVYGVAYSPNGDRIAATSQDRSVYILDADTRQSKVLRGHEDQVFSVAWSPDGTRLATGTWSGKVGLWDTKTLAVQLLSGHEDQVWSVAWSPDGSMLASAGFDDVVRLWDGATGEALRVLTGHGADVNDVAFSPDGRLLASASHDRTVRLWEVATGRETLRIDDPSSHVLAFHPTGDRLVTGGIGGQVSLRDVRTGEVVRAFRGGSEFVSQVTFLGDGELLAVARWAGRVEIWDVESAELRWSYDWDASVEAMAVRPGSSEIALSSREGWVRVVDAARPPLAESPAGHASGVSDGRIQPGGTLLATAGQDGTVRLWNLETGELERVLEVGGQLHVAAWSPDGRRLAVGGTDRAVHLWLPAVGQEEAVLAGHRAQVDALAFSPDGLSIVSGGADQAVRVWDLAERRQRFLFRGHQGQVLDVAFSPAGDAVASAGVDGTVRLWPLAEGSSGRVVGRHDGPVWGLEWSADGSLIVSGGEDQTVRAWSVETGTERRLSDYGARVLDVALSGDGERLAIAGADGLAAGVGLRSAAATTMTGHRAEVNAVSFDRDGRVVATVSDDGTARLWDAETGAPRWRAPVLLGSSSKLLSHRGWVALGDGAGGGEDIPAPLADALATRALWATESRDGGLLCLQTAGEEVELWDVRRGRRLASEGLAGLRRALATSSGCLALTPAEAVLLPPEGEARELSVRASSIAVDDLGLLVAGEGRIYSYDHGAEPMATFAEPPDARTMARVGAFLVVGFGDGNAEVYSRETRSPEPLRGLQATPSSPVERIVAGPEGTVALGYASGQWGLWDVATGVVLLEGRVHGSVVHLDYREGRLLVASDLGAHDRVDLSVFEAPYCDLMRQIWSRVQVEWHEGAAAEASPPPDHECAPDPT